MASAREALEPDMASGRYGLQPVTAQAWATDRAS